MDVFDSFLAKKTKTQSEVLNQLRSLAFYDSKKETIHPRLASLIRKKYTETLKDFLKFRKKLSQKFCKCDYLIQKKGVILKIFYSTFQAFLSLFATILYILGTYYQKTSTSSPEENMKVEYINNFEMTISAFIGLSLIINFLSSQHKKNFFSKYSTWIDLITIIPIYFQNLITVSNIGFFRIFRLIRVIRVLRLFKFLNLKKRINKGGDLGKKIIESCVILVCYIFISAGFVNYLNSEFNSTFKMNDSSKVNYGCNATSGFSIIDINITNTDVRTQVGCENDPLISKPTYLSFDGSLYFTVITLFTIGYGDIVPTTIYSKMIIGVLIICIIIIVTKQMGEINEILANRNKNLYSASYESNGRNHVIVGGFYSANSLSLFLHEFYNSDHQKIKGLNEKECDVVLIQPYPPAEDIKKLLSHTLFQDNLFYIQGDILDKVTLNRARIQTSNHVFLLSNQDSSSVKNDHFLTLACKSISQISDIKVYVQFTHPQSLINVWVDYSVGFSTYQVKNYIIYKNCFIRGFASMIMNLTSSSKVFYIDDIIETPWMIEYIQGTSQEIYIIKNNNPEFEVKGDFTEFVRETFLNFGIIIIGVRHKIYYKNFEEDEFQDVHYYEYLINPQNYKLSKDDSMICIAKDRKKAIKIFDQNKMKYKEKNQTVEMKKLINYFVDVTERKDKGFVLPDFFTKQREFNTFHCATILKDYLQNHYIVFSNDNNFYHFANVFFKTETEMIFFVCNKRETEGKVDEMKKWKKFPNVVKIELNYDVKSDIETLNLSKARHVFILTYEKEGISILDSGILPLLKLIESEFPDTNYTVELADENSVKYLNNEIPDIKKSDDTGMLNNKEKIDLIPFTVWPKYAKSDIYFSSSLETLLPFTYHNKGLLELLIKLLGIEDDQNKGAKKFHNIKENKEFRIIKYNGGPSIPYSEVVKFFLELEEPVICIAIYRKVFNENDEGEDMKNSQPYISTNPDKNRTLRSGDELICLGKSKIFNQFKSPTQRQSLRTQGSTERFLEMKSQRTLERSETRKEEYFKFIENYDEGRLLDEYKKNVLGLKDSMIKVKRMIRENTEKNFTDDFYVLDENDNFDFNEVDSNIPEPVKKDRIVFNQLDIVNEVREDNGIVVDSEDSVSINTNENSITKKMREDNSFLIKLGSDVGISEEAIKTNENSQGRKSNKRRKIFKKKKPYFNKICKFLNDENVDLKQTWDFIINNQKSLLKKSE